MRVRIWRIVSEREKEREVGEKKVVSDKETVD